VGDQAFLAGFRQVVRQQQQPSAPALGFAGIGCRDAGRAADTGQNRHFTGAGIHGGLDDVGYSLGSARRTRPCRRRRTARSRHMAPAIQTFNVGRLAEVAFGVEVGDRERQQAGREDFFRSFGCIQSPVCEVDMGAPFLRLVV
jgi:hypothetical protein